MKNSILVIFSKQILLFSLLGLFFGLVVTQSIYSTTLYGFCIALLLVIFIFLYQTTLKISDIPFVLLLMLVSFLIKMILVFVFEHIMLNKIGIPFLSYRDDYVYDITSSEILKAWQARGVGFYSDVYFSTGFYSGYPNVSALAKFIFGDHYLAPRFANVFFSTLTVFFYFITVKKLTNDIKHVKLIAIIFAFSPVFIVYSSLQLKDTILIFFLSTLIYGTVSFYTKGFRLKYATLVVASMGALLFFRAAILLPYILSLIMIITLVDKGIGSKVKGIAWVGFIFISLYLLWEYLSSTDLLSMSGNDYFDSRFSSRDKKDVYSGSNDLSKLGMIAIILGPILVLLSFILPTPVYLQLDEFTNSVPYHYLPLIAYYAILPMACICFLYIIKNYKLYKVGLFLVIFIFLYKLGQAGSKSIFDSRQSLPAIYGAYLLLAYFNLDNNEVKRIWIRYRVIIIFIMIFVMFSFTFSRYILRSI